MKDNDNALIAHYSRANGSFKRGLLTAAVFAVAGLSSRSPDCSSPEPFRRLFTLPRLPGWWLLGLFFSSMKIGHGAFVSTAYERSCIRHGRIRTGITFPGPVVPRFEAVRALPIVIVVCMFALPVGSYVKDVRWLAQQRAGYEKRLREDPNDVKALYCLGYHHFSRTGDLRQAEGYFRKLVELEPPPPLRPYTATESSVSRPGLSGGGAG